jgi:hypothetical protein
MFSNITYSFAASTLYINISATRVILKICNRTKFQNFSELTGIHDGTSGEEWSIEVG